METVPSNNSNSIQEQSSSRHECENGNQLKFQLDDEEEALKCMNSAIREVDKLLNNYAVMVSKYPSSSDKPEPDYKYYGGGQSKSYRVLSEADLKAFAASFEVETDIIGIQRSTSRMINDSIDSILFLPMSLMSLDKNWALSVPGVDHIKDNLLTYKTVISIHQICTNSCFEVPHIGDGYYCGENNGNNNNNNKGEFMDPNDLMRLKEKNKFEWERTISNIEYERLKQQIYQVVSDLDLQLDKIATDQIADQVICLAVGWNRNCNRSVVKTWATMAVRKLFGNHSAGRFIVKVVDDNDHMKMSNVRCHIGSRPWGDYHGIGMNVETIIK